MAIKAESRLTKEEKQALALRHRRRLLKESLEKAGVYLILILVTIVLGMPFFWMLTTSFKTPQEIAIFPPTLLPNQLKWDNFIAAWNVAPFDLFYFNSIFTGVVSTFLQVLFALFMAYALVFIPFPFKRLLFLLVLATMMIPVEMKLVPNFILLKELGDLSRIGDPVAESVLSGVGLKIRPAQICCGINSYFALIVPPAAHAFPVFVLYQQFRILPRDLIDAAKVDGASHLQTLWWVVTPISRPVLAATVLIAFVGRWNDYLWPLIITQSEAMRTLPVGLGYLRATSEEGSTPWNLLMAASIFVILPILVLFIFTQKQFVKGITTGAVKG
jgi:ABC-type glycerol-3-phosphate transport system permease component